MKQTEFESLSHPATERYLIRADTLLVNSSPGQARLRLAEKHIVCGDALEVLSGFSTDSVDLVHTSPPYNIDRPYESGTKDKSSAENYEAFLRAVINELKRIVRPGGSVFWQTGYTQNGGTPGEIVPIDLISYHMFHGEPSPFALWDRIIWRYWGGHAFTKKFTNKHESILWFVKPGREPTFVVDAVREKAKEYDKRNNFWGRNPGNVWEVDRVAFGSTEQTSHIAVFPEEIAERIVRACSEPGGLVLDPFVGSGTVAKVAHGLGRSWIGIEISPVYAHEAAVRVGFQQPSEPDSLASELIKLVAFRGRRGSLGISEVAARVRAWVGAVRILELWESFETDVRSVFNDNGGRNLLKRDVWMKYDARLQVARSEDAVAVADQLLCGCYKLRQQFNGVTRFKTALTALQTVAANVTGPSQATYYLASVASQEPSSYQINEGTVSLVSPTRSVINGRAKVSEETETFQRRLQL